MTDDKKEKSTEHEYGEKNSLELELNTASCSENPSEVIVKNPEKSHIDNKGMQVLNLNIQNIICNRIFFFKLYS